MELKEPGFFNRENIFALPLDIKPTSYYYCAAQNTTIINRKAERYGKADTPHRPSL